MKGYRGAVGKVVYDDRLLFLITKLKKLLVLNLTLIGLKHTSILIPVVSRITQYLSHSALKHEVKFVLTYN